MRARSWYLSLWLVGCLFASTARADLYTAVAAYEKKDFPRAFELFRELAEIGHPMAQETLAVMYVRGEGVPRDNVLGYAWAVITQENGLTANVQPIIDQVGPRLSPSSRKIADDVRGRFGKAALEERLLPRKTGSETPEGQPTRPVCRMAHPVNPDDFYPREAIRQGVAGIVQIRTTVLPDGRARNPRVTLSVPPNAFITAGRSIAFARGFEAPQQNGVAVPCTISFKVRFSIKPRGVPPQVAKEAQRLERDATAGDPLAQFQYALLLTGWSELNPDNKDLLPLFLSAAQAGVHSAQYVVGDSLLGRAGERQKGLRWLAMAADAGQQDAQIALASELLAVGNADDVARARALLEKAIEAGNEEAAYHLADLLIGDETSRRNPQRALDLLSEVFALKDDDPTTLEIRAAAYSQLGDFAAAVNAQTTALRKAKALRWNTAPQAERLQLYEQHQPWAQRLLVY
jgi:TPR repeat protein